MPDPCHPGPGWVWKEQAPEHNEHIWPPQPPVMPCWQQHKRMWPSQPGAAAQPARPEPGGLLWLPLGGSWQQTHLRVWPHHKRPPQPVSVDVLPLFLPKREQGRAGHPPFPASRCGLGPNWSRGMQGTPLFLMSRFVLLQLAFHHGHCLAMCHSKHVCALALVGQRLRSQCRSTRGLVSLALMCSCRLSLLGQHVKGCPRCHAIGGVLEAIAPRAMASTPWAPAA
jgi:hypothetical protein